MIRKACLIAFLLLPAQLLAAGGGALELQRADNDLGNLASLQRGAKYFVNYCLGCHSAKYVRYNRLAQDLQLSEQQLSENLMFTGNKPHDTMSIAMQDDAARRWFGRTPPDLSLVARSRTTDWVYTYLKSFYVDDSRPFGVNNMLLDGASMPHVLWELQGIQRAVFHEYDDESGSQHRDFEGFELVSAGVLSEKEFERMLRDLVNFLDYISEPMQLQRQSLGIGVLAFLLVFFIVALMLKNEIWKDVH